MRQAAQRLQQVVVALLALFRSGAEPQWQRVDLPALGHRLPVAGVAVHTSGPAAIDADPDLLAAALANLLDNAQRHGAANVWIDVQADSTGAGVVLTVRDDGSGMAPAQRAALALALAQARDASPLGLGLMLVDQAARARGGRATLRLPDSPDARGCTICLQLGRPGTG
ncbi:MAG TPA: ATP-binding protein [Aquabacterium sp.]|nr:ATP-binding protein [Aquabacterium sp.]